MSDTAALLDANVLFSPPLRDLLIELACVGLYRARWTEKIHDEWGRAVLKVRDDIPVDVVDEMRRCMNHSVPDCVVEDYAGAAGEACLPDADDLHVLEAAIKGECSYIVTRNLRDFPNKILRPFALEAVAPDLFLCRLFEKDPALFIEGLDKVRGRFTELSFERHMEILKKNRLKKVVGLIKGV